MACCTATALIEFIFILKATAFAGIPTTPECTPPSGGVSLILPVRVISTGPQPDPPYPRGDFAVTAGRKTIPVCALAYTRLPTSFGIVLDTSASMDVADPTLKGAREGLKRLLDAASPQDEFFVVAVSGGPELRSPFTSDVKQTLDALALHPKGRTPLLDTLALALSTMRGALHPNRCLLVISDAIDTSSTVDAKKLSQILAQTPVPIFLIMVAGRSTPLSRFQDERFLREDVLQVVRASGGYTVESTTERNSPTLIAAVVESMRTPYLLKFALPHAATSTDLGSVKVEVRSRGPKPVLLYRGGFLKRGQ